jgi:hypothetical protein
VERSAAGAALQRLEGELNRRRQSAQQLAAIPALTRQHLQQRNAQTRLEAMESSPQQAQAQLSARLQALGVASLDGAEGLLEQRSALEQQQAGLPSAAAGSAEALERQHREQEQEQELENARSALLQFRQQQLSETSSWRWCAPS